MHTYLQYPIPDSKLLYRVTFSLHVLLGEAPRIFPLLKAIGFTWDKAGFENFDLYWASIKDALPSLDRTCESTAMRLLIYLASPAARKSTDTDTHVDSNLDSNLDQDLDTAVNAWLPSPAKIAEMERANTW